MSESGSVRESAHPIPLSRLSSPGIMGKHSDDSCSGRTVIRPAVNNEHIPGIVITCTNQKQSQLCRMARRAMSTAATTDRAYLRRRHFDIANRFRDHHRKNRTLLGLRISVSEASVSARISKVRTRNFVDVVGFFPGEILLKRPKLMWGAAAGDDAMGRPGPGRALSG